MPQPLQLAIAERAKSVRGQMALTQKEVAEAIGVTHGTYFLAEAYGRMGIKTRRKLDKWLTKQENKIARTRKDPS